MAEGEASLLSLLAQCSSRVPQGHGAITSFCGFTDRSAKTQRGQRASLRSHSLGLLQAVQGPSEFSLVPVLGRRLSTE